MPTRRKQIISTMLVVSAGIGACMAGGIAPATAATQPELAQSELRTATLSKPISFAAAENLAKSSGLPVVGYGYETVGVIGEFYKSSSTSAFLREFRDLYGTEPAVTSFRITTDDNAPRVATTSVAAVDDLTVAVPDTIRAYKAAPSESGTAWTQMAKARAKAKTQEPASQARAAAPAVWSPSFAEYGSFNQSTRSVLWQRFVWSGTAGSSPLNRDLRWGLEFEMNLQNNSLPAGVRPACPSSSDPTVIDSSFRGKFWAQNRNYDWQLFYTNGQTPAQLGAYADTNDQFDLCRTQSMAVGIRNPGLLNSAGSTSLYELAIRISAPRGTTSSAVATNIQAVEGLSCQKAPWNGKISTDCMGLDENLPPSGVDNTRNYGTGNISRGFRAPNTCWNFYLEPGSTPDRVATFDCSLLG